jgi:hypothetical protein
MGYESVGGGRPAPETLRIAKQLAANVGYQVLSVVQSLF